MKYENMKRQTDSKQYEKTVDEILEIVGPFNKYQWILLGMLSYCMWTLGLQSLTMTFTASDPGWQCTRIGNSSSCYVSGVVTPTMDGYKDRCNMQREEWKYPDGSSSIVVEFDLICDRSILKNVATSMVYLGWFFGSIFFGYISDRFGRRICLLSAMMTMSIAGMISGFVGIFWLFSLLKVFVGAGVGGSIICLYILNTEFVGPQKRAFAGIFIFNFLTIGVCCVSLFAYLLKDWKYLSLTTSGPALLIIFLYCFIPESIRWLLVNDRREEAENLLKKAADVNGFAYPLEIYLKQENIGEKKGGNVAEICRHRSLTVYTIISIIVWFTCSMTYYGVSLSTGHLGGDFYLVFFLTTIVAIPANFVSSFVIGKYGRKKSLIITISGTAISIVAASLLPTSPQVYVIIRVTLAMVAKFLITISFNAVYLLTFELLPTTLRNVGMGMASASARVGSFSASFVIFLNMYNKILPFVVIGVLALLSAGVSLIFPETKDLPTKETTNDDHHDDVTSNENIELKVQQTA